MIIKNIGLTKDIKIDGILIKINPGINIFDDIPVLRNIIKTHPDLSIVTDTINNVVNIVKEVSKDIVDKNINIESIEHIIKDVGNLLKHNEEESNELPKENSVAEGEDSAIELKSQEFQSFRKNRKGRK